MTSILIVDDSPAQRCALERSLRQIELELEEIRVATTAREALDALSAAEIDVVFCDASLPDGDGLELLEKIRAQCEETVCLMLTGHASDELAKRARARGARGTLARPYGQERLEDTMKKAIRQSAKR